MSDFVLGMITGGTCVILGIVLYDVIREVVSKTIKKKVK